MSQISAVIFDAFETLFHNDPALWQQSFRDLCQAQHLDIEPLVLWQEWKTRERRFRKTRLNLEQPELSPPFKSYCQAWRDTFRETFQAISLKGDPDAAVGLCVEALTRREPFPEVREAIEGLRGRWRLGVLSNADDAFLYPLLRRTGLTFDVVRTSEGCRAYKPLPGPFHQVCGLLHVQPQEALYVGDSLLDDVHGAKRVGMRAAWVNRNGLSREEGLLPPDYEIHSLMEMENILA
ncbi:MAG: HAD family hydrolase [Chloroflexi bacterium]|nr:HAD family hydrolase [Chloroflexota bacterium]